MKLTKVLGLVAAVAFLAAAPAQAATITLAPGDMIPANLGPSNCEPDCIYDTFGLDDTVIDLELLYKQNVGGSEAGSFADFYSTEFFNSPTDPQDGTLTWGGPSAISCPACFLAVKDGNQNPSYYFYDLSGWNGTDTIELVGFWPQQGAISHFSIWGYDGGDGDGGDGGGDGDGGNVPEPGILALFGAGLTVLAGRLKRR